MQMQLTTAPTVIPVGYCQCGCGRKTTLATKTRRGYTKGDPVRYLSGHHFKEVSKRPRSAPIVDGKKLCRKCNELKPVAEFPNRRRNELRGVCRGCRREDMRWRNCRAKYGIDKADWFAMFAAQGNGCAICRCSDPGGRGWHVDHDHACCPGGKSCGRCVRAILCSNCNVGLGAFKDSTELLERANAYLRHYDPEGDLATDGRPAPCV